MRNSLVGKSALVTGAGQGLGFSYARLMAQAGARVVVNDLGATWKGEGRETRAAANAAERIRKDGGEAVPNFDDVASETGAANMIEQCVSRHGGLDIVVCNAGILRDSMVFNMRAEDWDIVVRTHLRGHFLPIHFASKYWRERYKASGEPQNASIILTSSRSGLYGSPGQVNYAAAKAGIAAMGTVLARELEKYGVRVNVVAPVAKTRLTEESFGQITSDRWSTENVAPLVAYLASDDSLGVSGQVFSVGGGRIEWLQGWSTKAELSAPDGNLSIDYIASRRDELFGDSPTSPGAYPLTSWS